jgi:hypothetical protein
VIPQSPTVCQPTTTTPKPITFHTPTQPHSPTTRQNKREKRRGSTKTGHRPQQRDIIDDSTIRTPTNTNTERIRDLGVCSLERR